MPVTQKKLLTVLFALVICAGIYSFTYGQWSLFKKSPPLQLNSSLPSPETPQSGSLSELSGMFMQSFPRLSRADFLTFLQSIGGSSAFSCDYADKDISMKVYVDSARVRADSVATSDSGYSVSLLLLGEDVYIWFPDKKDGYLVQGENQDIVFGMAHDELSKKRAAIMKSCKEGAPAASIFKKPDGISFQQGF